MAGKKKVNKEASFEEALNELEEIVRLMEEGSLELDSALANFEKGIALARICAQKLEQAEKRVDILLKNNAGEITLIPANITEDSNE